MRDWKRAVAERLARLERPAAREREIIDELSQHLEDRYQELRLGGTDHDEAVRLALDELDDEDLLAREMRRLERWRAPEPIAAGAPPGGWLRDVWQDVVYAARMLRKQRGFAAAAILTLALGIGANTVIFSLVNATLLQRLPVQNRERLVAVFGSVFSFPSYAAVRDGTRLMDGLAAWGAITASLNTDGRTDLVSGAIVTGNYFDLLGVGAERGRTLAPSDDVTPGAHRVAVISHRLWHTRFGARADIVGHEVHLNGQVFTIAGVMGPRFRSAEIGLTHDLFVPMMMQALMRPPRAGYSGEMNPDLLGNPNNGWLIVFGLVKPGVSPRQAQAELSALNTTFMKTVLPNARPRELTLVPIDEGDPERRRQMRSIAILLGCVVGAILLIACANVANLLLAKAAARRREVAIRLAIGASRGRIVRQLLTESVMLAAIGGSAGLLLTWIVAQSFRAAPPPAGALPIAIDFTVDRRVLAFSLLVSVVTGIIFGTAPALHAARPELAPALKDDAFVRDERARRFNLKNGLVVAEVALSLLLLIAAGLFLRSLWTIQTIDPGIAAGEIVTAPLNVNILRYTKVQGREFYQRIIDRMQQVPGVKSASVARMPLLSGAARITGVTPEGQANSTNNTGGAANREDIAMANVIGPRFLETVGIPLIRGRDFSAQDVEDRPLVAIVSETFASRFFPGEDALGKRFSTGFSNASGRWTEIVGIARDSKYARLEESPTPVVYMPLSQRHESGVTLFVRSALPPASVIPQVRREIQALEPNLPVPDVQSMEDTIGTSLYAQRTGTMLLTIFGGLALFLAALGVYGVLAFSTSRRTRELGIRMALGADRRGVFTLVVREGMWLVAIGLAIGMAAGFYAAEFMGRFLFGIATRDAVTFASVPCVLAAVALAACYLPARRATQVDPMVALRDT